MDPIGTTERGLMRAPLRRAKRRQRLKRRGNFTVKSVDRARELLLDGLHQLVALRFHLVLVCSENFSPLNDRHDGADHGCGRGKNSSDVGH